MHGNVCTPGSSFRVSWKFLLPIDLFNAVKMVKMVSEFQKTRHALIQEAGIGSLRETIAG